MGRLKTGTPPRLHRRQHRLRSAASSAGLFVEERGDDVRCRSRSRRRSRFGIERAAGCFTRTIASAISFARASTRARSTTGRFKASVRATVRRSKTRSCGFPQRERHQIYLEPEGLDVDEIYVNGFSTSLPREVQEALVHALPGLEDAVDVATWLCGGVRLRPADGAEGHARNASSRRACFSRARSTAHPATRRLRLKASLRASTPRAACSVRPHL